MIFLRNLTWLFASQSCIIMFLISLFFIKKFFDGLNILTRSTWTILLTIVKIHYETWSYACYMFTYTVILASFFELEKCSSWKMIITKNFWNISAHAINHTLKSMCVLAHVWLTAGPWGNKICYVLCLIF